MSYIGRCAIAFEQRNAATNHSSGEINKSNIQLFSEVHGKETGVDVINKRQAGRVYSISLLN